AGRKVGGGGRAEIDAGAGLAGRERHVVDAAGGRGRRRAGGGRAADVVAAGGEAAEAVVAGRIGRGGALTRVDAGVAVRVKPDGDAGPAGFARVAGAVAVDIGEGCAGDRRVVGGGAVGAGHVPADQAEDAGVVGGPVEHLARAGGRVHRADVDAG